MGTFSYYRSVTPPMSPLGWFGYSILLGTIFIAYRKYETYEDILDMGELRNRTFLYYNYHTNVAKHPNRETFKRIE